MKRLTALLLAAICVLAPAVSAVAAEQDVTILFTHDLHSHFEPVADGTGGTYGGFAKLQTIIREQKTLHPNAVLVDGGDFSMGSLFQTVYATDAAELRLMGKLGYDATTLGNHEFDYRAHGLADMLNAAAKSGAALPAIVQANYRPAEGADKEDVERAFATANVQDYTVVSRGGVNFAIFGLIGKDAHACAPMSDMELEAPIRAAKRVIADIEETVAEPRVVICLSHSGTWEKESQSEDEQLAKEVDGIDVIVSGHTHTTMEAPVVIGDTYIVSCGEYGKNLGVLTLGSGGASYQLIPITREVPDDTAIREEIEAFKETVVENYLTQFGISAFDEVLAENPYAYAPFTVGEESPLGNLIADSYAWAAEKAQPGEPPVDFALNATGVIRETLPQGSVTVEQVFNMLSLGIGADGIPGYPLVSVYITGKDLRNIFEVDASVTSLMPAAQLHFTGMQYHLNPNRMIFDRVTDCGKIMPDGSVVPIADDRLYRVVTGLYCGQMLGAVNSQSMGILTITPRDQDGRPIADLEAYIIHDETGREVKEWYALASYLQHLGTVPETYAAPLGRKVMNDSRNPVDLLRSPNWITLTVLGLCVIVFSAVMLVVYFVMKRKKKAGASYETFTGRN